MEPVVTVGLDGSPESLAAARWAADEAERRKLTLRLLHAWPLLVPEPTRIPAEMDQNYWAKRIVHNARAELQARHPGLSIVGNLVSDDAQNALLQAASESEMIVLGSRGLEPVQSYFLGDISMHVVARAERPVVLVRAETHEEGPPPTPGTAGGVAVAVKLHGPCDDLLEFSFATAAARGMPLRAVHGQSVPLHAHLPWGMDHDVTEEITQDARKHLSKAPRPRAREVPACGGGRQHRSRRPRQGRGTGRRGRRAAGRRPTQAPSRPGATPGSRGHRRHPSRSLPCRRRPP